MQIDPKEKKDEREEEETIGRQYERHIDRMYGREDKDSDKDDD